MCVGNFLVPDYYAATLKFYIKNIRPLFGPKNDCQELFLDAKGRPLSIARSEIFRIMLTFLESEEISTIVPYMVKMFLPGTHIRPGEFRRGTATMLQAKYLETKIGISILDISFFSLDEQDFHFNRRFFSTLSS